MRRSARNLRSTSVNRTRRAGTGGALGCQEWTLGHIKSAPLLFRQELHPMVAHRMPVFLRTSIECRPITRHEYAVEPLII
jgi:hypothetical protein